MNKERLLALAEHLEKVPHHDLSSDMWSRFPPINFDEVPTTFNMNKWFEKRGCGTVACIAGHAFALWKPSLSPDQAQLMDHPEAYVYNMGKEILGLTEREADHLFLGYWTNKPTHAITPQEAAARLREMAGE